MRALLQKRAWDGIVIYIYISIYIVQYRLLINFYIITREMSGGGGVNVIHIIWHTIECFLN